MTMTVHIHAAPVPAVDSFTSLQDWLDARLALVEEDLADGETAQAMGSRLRERRATLLDVVHVIQEAVAIEKQEQATVSAELAGEAAWRERYPDADELTLRRLSGDR
jgi:hypothetical protein